MNLRFWSVLLLAVGVLAASPARAELLRAEFKLPGMDCAYCNTTMGAAVKKLDGVESMDLDPAKGTAVVKLKPGNTITLAQLRRVIKSVGYEAKDADITARGRVHPDGRAIELFDGFTLQLAVIERGRAGAKVEVTGVAKAAENDKEILTVTKIQ